MAKRFGGKYSPTSDNSGADPAASAAPSPFRDRQPARVSVFARLLFLAPLPLLIAGLGEVMSGNASRALLELGAFAVLMLAAWLLNEGLTAEAAFNARKIARPPGFPRKIAAACLVGAGVFAVQGIGAGNLIAGAIFGGMATAAQLFAFGLDPMRAKGMEGVDTFATDRVARAIEAAEDHLKDMASAAKRTGDRAIISRVSDMAATARDVFRTVEDDPRDLPRARKFLGVYLQGARDATVKFADVYARGGGADAREDYMALLTDLEASFTKHRADLLEDNRTDLDVEIEVLRERLHQEGLKA
ncbi:MAG: 5-bromo-4-chloroindolyl phosphate hydrolysis family protein [Pseudomonadota bacterium]